VESSRPVDPPRGDAGVEPVSSTSWPATRLLQWAERYQLCPTGAYPPENSALTPDLVEDKVADPEAAARLRLDRYLQDSILTSFQLERLQHRQGRFLRLGPYRLLETIGRGGMGLVYLAERTPPDLPEGTWQPGDWCALKLLSPRRAAAAPRMRARFLHERELGLQLPLHPALVRLRDGGEDQGVIFLTMEYLPGQTLRERLREYGPLPFGWVAYWFAQLAEGLSVLHDAGVIHRDLKPGNILLQPSGQATWLDYGFAWRYQDPVQQPDPEVFGGAGTILGTMDYLAPEQARGELDLGPAADYYALGCCLFAALTGQPPFAGQSARAKLRLHREAAFPDVSVYNPTVPSAARQLLLELTRKSPQARLQSGPELVSLLRAWAEPPPTGAPPSRRETLAELALKRQRVRKPSSLIPDSTTTRTIQTPGTPTVPQSDNPPTPTATLTNRWHWNRLRSVSQNQLRWLIWIWWGLGLLAFGLGWWWGWSKP